MVFSSSSSRQRRLSRCKALQGCSKRSKVPTSLIFRRLLHLESSHRILRWIWAHSFFFLRFADTHPFPLPSSLRRERDTEEKAASWDVRDVPSSRDRHVLGEGWWQPFPGPATGSSWHHEILGFCNCEEFSFSLNEQVQLQVSEIVSCQTSLPIKTAPFYRIISID